ncbi:MAG: hypothetical protein Q4A74_03530 [Cardiobacteriaceae bacterium]|nr:hypothetical protein [Cardiobacteriaceae bacterium]
MTFHHTPLNTDNRNSLQQAIDGGRMPFPSPAIPDEWWLDGDHHAALWATPAAGTTPLDFLWHYYLSINGEYYRFLLQPEPLPSAHITLYKLKEMLPSDCYGNPRESVINTLKSALISKTASGEHEAFFNF